VKTPDYFNVLVSPEKIRIRGAGWVRSLVVAAFIALIALFFTAPVDQGRSAYDAPLPMPPGVEQPAQAN